jgi:PST family polysaccharide transporter
LGFLLSDQELGLFSAAMKLIVVGQSFLFNPMGGALYPHLAQVAKGNLETFSKERRRFQGYMVGLTALSAIVIMAFPKFWVQLVFGHQYIDVAPILALMAPVLVLTAFSHFSMKQGLMVIKADRIHLKVVLFAGVASILLNYLLIQQWGLAGAAWAKLLVEATLALSAFYYFKKTLAQKLLKK